MTRSKKIEINKNEEVIIKNSIAHSRKHSIASSSTETQKINDFRNMMERLLNRVEEGEFEDSKY